MRLKKTPVALTLAALALALIPIAAAQAAGPAWNLGAYPLPTYFPPGSEEDVILLVAHNVGDGPTSGTVTVTDTLPEGVLPTNADIKGSCEISGQSVTCTSAETVEPGQRIRVTIRLTAPSLPEGTVLPDQAIVSGGAAAAASADTTETIATEPPPFGFLPGAAGFAAVLGEGDGVPASLAGSHPYQLSLDMAFPTRTSEGAGKALLAAGHLRDSFADLPRGFLLDPTATPVRCTEAELITSPEPSCPTASQVGTIGLLTTVVGSQQDSVAPLYNMVPPPGAPAELGFEAGGIDIFAHIVGALRSDSDYGLSGGSADIDALPVNPIFGVHLEFWGDPSATSHDFVRGSRCAEVSCETGISTPPTAESLLTLSGDCPAAPKVFAARADSWEEPGLFHQASFPGPGLSGCNALEYQPTISAQPTTNLADSPSGLDFELHQPQDFDKEHLATAELKDARVTLPEGLVANPSQADGLAACTQSQIGYLGEGHYSKDPQSCPDAAKLGTMEVASPLLAEYSEGGAKLATDPETGAPIPRPLQGSVYLAKPYENQLGTLLAIYLVVEDKQSGIVAKLAGKVEPDPSTGQLSTVFEENPELPLEDVKLHLFGGSRASLITPISCGAHTTTSTLTPWSAPETPDANPSDSFQTSAEPGGGSCPSSEAAAANKPAFQAGTLAPQAGAFSPFVLKLSREDGSQRIAGIDTTLPPGLTGKLAGIQQCSEAQIAQARAREKPNEGILEREGPSCPASTQVGTVDIAAGAGPTPFHTQGKVYLAGPYKGAPLSLAVIVPAVAGPFDLGAVVSRVALHVEPETAQIHAVSDPLPQIIEGIPLDVRSIALSMDRSQFTLNPTSCDPMQITGSATSALGGSAALSNPFQVGGCPQLPFKPKLSLKLKGGTKRTGHPKLIANLKAKPGEANVASAQVKLPPSAFLDQAHIRTVCTRVQFAANACPSGSIYGKAEATTPLLAYPLSGNVYLRSSNHKLPDLVVALKGPDYQPIEIDLVGKTDSVKGALRNTFEAVPDAPVSTFRLELFGGKRGLVVNSRNLCAHAYKAEVNLTGQNGKVSDTEPVVGTGCKGKHKRHHR